jgi:protein-L-isoaspartate(D-aspartate) O-methyltransferase
MFYRQVYKSNEELVEALTSKGALRSQLVIDAFLKVDRKLFVPENQADQAYGDFPLEIGEGQTISQPTTVATMIELLEPQAGHIVLDVGSGSGYLSAIIGHMVASDGEVHATEVRQSLYQTGLDNLSKAGLKNVHLHYTPNQLGWPQSAPYDRIVASAAATDIPDALLEQLKAPGLMVLPVGDSLTVVKKDSHGRTTQQAHYGYAFVPLVQKA